MNNPIYSDPEWMHKFLHNAAIYFESRPTNGEDTAYWANVYNAEKCIKIADEITRLSARVTDLEEKAKKAKFMHKYEVKEWQARVAKLERLVEILLENDPDDMAADAVTVLDVWRKEASELMARHARLDARQAGMEQMRADESAEIRTAIRAAAFDKAERFAGDALEG